MKYTTPTLGSATPDRPSIAQAVAAVTNYVTARKGTLSAAVSEKLAEIVRRLERLTVQFDELMALNDKFMAATGMSSEFDPSTDTVTFRFGDQEMKMQLKRADPNPESVRQYRGIQADSLFASHPGTEQPHRAS